MKKTLLLLLGLCLLFTSIISCESPCAHADKQMHPAVAATCTQPGSSAYYSCPSCGKYFSEESCTQEIAKDSWLTLPIPHTITIEHSALTATKENPGNIAYKECSVCHKCFDNVDTTKEITLESTKIYVVSYDENKPGEISATIANMPQGASYQSGSLITKPESPTLTDCVFGGWYTDSGCTNAFDFTQTKVTLTLTLYAKWILSSVEKNGVQYTLVNNYGVSEYQIIGCSADTVKLILLAEIEGIPVTRITDNAFSNKSKLTGDLVIPDSVTSIGVYAFNGCKGFNGTLTVGNKVESIGEWAFNWCTGFTGNLTIGNNVNTIKDFTFSGCKGFTGDLTIPDSVTSIGTQAFFECSSFSGKLTIGKAVTDIGSMAFYYCEGFTSLVFVSEQRPTIGSLAFKNCTIQP